MRKRLSLKEAADELGISRNTLRKWIDKGKINATRNNRNEWQFTSVAVKNVLCDKPQEPDNIIVIPTQEIPKCSIKEMLLNSEKKRVLALLDELENGKGLARLKAEQRLAEIEGEIELEDESLEIEINWDLVATRNITKKKA